MSEPVINLHAESACEASLVAGTGEACASADDLLLRQGYEPDPVNEAPDLQEHGVKISGFFTTLLAALYVLISEKPVLVTDSLPLRAPLRRRAAD